MLATYCTVQVKLWRLDVLIIRFPKARLLPKLHITLKQAQLKQHRRKKRESKADTLRRGENVDAIAVDWMLVSSQNSYLKPNSQWVRIVVCDFWRWLGLEGRVLVSRISTPTKKASESSHLFHHVRTKRENRPINELGNRPSPDTVTWSWTVRDNFLSCIRSPSLQYFQSSLDVLRHYFKIFEMFS